MRWCGSGKGGGVAFFISFFISTWLHSHHPPFILAKSWRPYSWHHELWASCPLPTIFSYDTSLPPFSAAEENPRHHVGLPSSDGAAAAAAGREHSHPLREGALHGASSPRGRPHARLLPPDAVRPRLRCATPCDILD